MGRLSLLTAGFLALVLAMVAQIAPAFADRVNFIVPVKAVYPGQVISDVGLSERGFYIKADAASLYVTDIKQVLNKVAKRTLIAGKPISLSALGEPILVNRGQSAKLVFNSGDLVITAMGVALQPGAAGDFIKIRNVDSGRVVTGTVMEDGSIQVGVQ